MRSYFTANERLDQLEKLAPMREQAFRNLEQLKKVRTDHRTIVLIPLKEQNHEPQMDNKKRTRTTHTAV